MDKYTMRTWSGRPAFFSTVFKAVLNEAGMNMDDLVFVQVFCPDLSLYDKFNSVYKNYFGKDYPARAFLSAGIVLRGAHFERNAIAVKR